MIRRLLAVVLLSTALCTGGVVSLVALLWASLLLPSFGRLATGSPEQGW